MKLLYYSPASYGGIADYAHEQANAFVELGIDVTFLCTPQYPIGRGEKYKVVPMLQETKPDRPLFHKALKVIHFTSVTFENFTKLARFIKEKEFQYVLLGSYVEYLAPLWSGRFRKLVKTGVIFGAIVHDPVRDFVVGFRWWHRWSIASGYSFLREAFVHEAIELDTVRPMPQLQTTVIPYGIHQFPDANQSREQTRMSLGLPLEAKVMLAFGNIRDGKNLDLVIQAMVYFPELYLVVAGKEQSSSQRPATFYQDLAKKLGVAERCRWEIRFISDIEIANFFEATDITLLTYSQTFRSASSVLSTSVRYKKPCLVSAGEGSLKSVVHKYQLGIWVEPDNLDAIKQGIKIWLEELLNSKWDRYHKEHSWKMNAQIVVESFLK